jgi:hypothetical protein
MRAGREGGEGRCHRVQEALDPKPLKQGQLMRQDEELTGVMTVHVCWSSIKSCMGQQSGRWRVKNMQG